MMEIRAFQAEEIFDEHQIKKEQLLLVQDAYFAGYISPEEAAMRQIPVERFGGAKILPGLFDSHIHGAVGADTMDASAASLDAIGQYLLSLGTTSWMPTTVTAELAAIEAAVAAVAAYVPGADKARVYGCFVEGPYLTAEHGGAHPPAYMRDLSQSELERLLKAGTVTALAVAPEKEGAQEFIHYAVERGIHISLAHTSASYEQAVAAIYSGADAVVHTFCGMTPMHHRSPNLVGAALVCDEVYAELIADGIHVQKPVMEVLRRCKPKGKLILVSDAISATGLKDGQYKLGLEAVTVKDGIPRTGTGSLAGSTTSLLDEVRRVILELGEDPLHAVHMASLNPSRRFGLEAEIGSIRAGKRADFIIVDKQYRLREVWKDGKRVNGGGSCK